MLLCGINEITFMLIPQNFMTFRSKGKGKADTRTGREGPERE